MQNSYDPQPSTSSLTIDGGPISNTKDERDFDIVLGTSLSLYLPLLSEQTQIPSLSTNNVQRQNTPEGVALNDLSSSEGFVYPSCSVPVSFLPLQFTQALIALSIPADWKHVLSLEE